MTDLSNTANVLLSDAANQLDAAGAHAGDAQDWCLRANLANWESPAAAIFSRWLQELVLTSRQVGARAADVRSVLKNV